MRNHILLGDKYERAFVRSGLDSKLITLPEDPFNPGHVDTSMDFILKDYKGNKFISQMLQMFLIYDKVTLVNPEVNLDYEKLIKTGFVKIISIDKEDVPKDREDSFIHEIQWNKFNLELAQLYKIPILKAFVEKRESINKRLHSRIIDELYTLFFGNQQRISQILFLTYELILWEGNISTYQSDITEKFIGVANLYEYLESQVIHLRNFTDLNFEFIYKYLRLYMKRGIYKLENLNKESDLQNGIILQDEFELNSIIKNKFELRKHQKADESRKAYQILRLSFKEKIQNLPKLSSIQEVILLKETKEKEIIRLREVLAEVEKSYREGREQAIAKSEHNIELALKDLNSGQNLEKVAKWATYLSVPIGITESLLGIPSILGVLTGVTGSMTTYNAINKQSRSGWLGVIR